MTDFQKTVLTMQPTKIEKIGEGRFGAHLASYNNGWRAVVKHSESKKAFRQLPCDQAHLREAAFYRLSQLFFPGVVPETYVTKIRDIECSAQKFTPGIQPRDYDKKLFKTKRDDFTGNLKDVLYKAAPRDDWKRLTLLDLIANSRDRHGKNLLIRPGADIPLVAIDNGYSLGKTFRSYRNVFHRYLFFYHLHAPHLLRELEEIEYKAIEDALVPLLDPVYAYNVMRRIEWVLEFPHRLPWRVISKGATRTVDFPSYKRWFSVGFRQLPLEPVLAKSKHPKVLDQSVVVPYL